MRTKTGIDYAGSLSVTKFGDKCNPWSKWGNQGYMDIYLYEWADDNVYEAGAKCRNVYSNYPRPRCYLPNGDWEECDLDHCTGFNYTLPSYVFFTLYTTLDGMHFPRIQHIIVIEATEIWSDEKIY